MAVPCGRRALSAIERRKTFARRLAFHSIEEALKQQPAAVLTDANKPVQYALRTL